MGALLWLALFVIERPSLAPRGVARGSLLVAAVACIGWISSGRPLPLHDDERLRFDPFVPARSVLNAGLTTSLVSAHGRSRTAWRSVDETKLALLSEHLPPRTVKPLDHPPDIIVIQAESLFDSLRLAQASEIADVLPHLRSQLQQGRGGELQIPSFGGGTIRTEFEVLSGIPLQALPDVSYPYLQLDNGDMYGIVAHLKRHGYGATAIHPNDAKTWQRQRVFQRMGFDRYIALEDFPEETALDGYFVSDQSLMDQVLLQLADNADPQFIFAISIEAHGPYEDNPVADPARRDAIQVPASMSAAASQELKNFLYHASNTDRQLGRLLDALRERQRRSIVVAYGDHLPGFHRVYDELAFSDGRSPNQQPTPFIIADSEQPAVFDGGVHVASWMLPGLLLQQAGLDDDHYFSLIQALGARLISGSDEILASFGADELRQLLDDVAIARISGRLRAEPGANEGDMVAP